MFSVVLAFEVQDSSRLRGATFAPFAKVGSNAQGFACWDTDSTVLILSFASPIIDAAVGGWPSIRARASSRAKMSYAVREHR